MNHDARLSGVTSARVHAFEGTRDESVELELHLGQEMLDVRLDATGIHFSHRYGTTTQGHLPWSTAIALSLLPPGRDRDGTLPTA